VSPTKSFHPINKLNEMYFAKSKYKHSECDSVSQMQTCHAVHQGVLLTKCKQ